MVPLRLWGLCVILTWAGPAFASPTELTTEFQDTQPKFIAQPDGTFGGLCLEIMALLEAQGGFRFTYPRQFVPVGRIVDDLRVGQIDVYFGLARTPERERDFEFLAELFSTRYQIIARKGDPLVQTSTIEALKASGVSVLVIRGSAQAHYFQTTLGLTVEQAPSSLEVSFRQLKAGNGRLLGYYDLGNHWFLETLGYSEHLAPLKVRLALDTHWLCISRSLAPETAKRLAAALAAVKTTPQWATLMKKYFP